MKIERGNSIYISISPIPLLNYSESEFEEIKESLKKLIRQLLKDSRVKEKLSSCKKIANKDDEELLFKYKTINGEIEIY